MAHKRMFSKDITGSDAFRDMPVSSQNLYFHLGMEADDDGFLGNYKALMRGVGSTDDDLKILLGKRFLLSFPSGVLVVKHWLLNNTVRKDRYHETVYTEEKKLLFIKQNNAYTDVATNGLPVGNHLATQYRIEEKRITSTSDEVQEVPEEEKPKKTTKPKYPHSKEVFGWFAHPQKSWTINTTELAHSELLWERGESRVKGALAFYNENKDDMYCPKITKPSDLERKWSDLSVFKKKNGL